VESGGVVVDVVDVVEGDVVVEAWRRMGWRGCCESGGEDGLCIVDASRVVVVRDAASE